MRHYILCIIAFLYTLVLHAQEGRDYRPFVEANKVWHVGRFRVIDAEPQWSEDYFFDGDTLINGTMYNQWICRCDAGLSYIGAIREEEGKVFFLPANDETERMVYNFKVQVGDTIQINIEGTEETDECTITHILPLEMQGHEVACYRFKDIFEGDGFTWNVWMEGIGSKCAPLSNACFRIGDSRCLISCEVNGTMIYHWTDNPLESIYELITAEVETLNMNNKGQSLKLFDLSGRRLAAPPAKGIYIKDGKKVVKPLP